MPCIDTPSPEKVRKLNEELREESFIREGKGRLKVTIESSGEALETTMSGSLKSVGEIAKILGVEAKGGKIEAVVDGVKVKMERGKLELEFDNGDRMRIEKA